MAVINKHSLERINTLAVALLGSAVVHGATPPEQTVVDVRQSQYDEKGLADDKISSGSGDRYVIDITQAKITAPVNEDFAVSIDLSREHMSGSSPMAIIRDQDNHPKALMSGATISETRSDINLSVSHFKENQLYSVDVYYSNENDYVSKGGGVHLEHEINNSLTFSVGLNAYNDTLNPTDAELFGRIQHAKKQKKVISAGLTQIINKNSLIGSGLSVTRVSGFLSDPYKLIDHRPELNTQWAWATNYRQYLKGIESAWHLDYRYYRDQYGIRSHTFKTSLHKDISKSWSAETGIRYYQQHEADFYVPFDFEQNDLTALQSSDFRLSSFASTSLNLGVKWQFEKWSFKARFESYFSTDKSNDHIANPALLDYQRLSFGLQYRFE